MRPRRHSSARMGTVMHTHAHRTSQRCLGFTFARRRGPFGIHDSGLLTVRVCVGGAPDFALRRALGSMKHFAPSFDGCIRRSPRSGCESNSMVSSNHLSSLVSSSRPHFAPSVSALIFLAPSLRPSSLKRPFSLPILLVSFSSFVRSFGHLGGPPCFVVCPFGREYGPASPVLEWLPHPIETFGQHHRSRPAS